MQVSFSQTSPFIQSPVWWHCFPSGESDLESYSPLEQFKLQFTLNSYVALVLGAKTGVLLTLKALHTVTGALALLTQLGLDPLWSRLISLRSWYSQLYRGAHITLILRRNAGIILAANQALDAVASDVARLTQL